MLKQRHFYSLRKRALFVSLAISIVVLLLSLFAHYKLNKAHTHALENIQLRTHYLEKLNFVRTDILAAYKDLNNFLLAPEKNEYRKSMFAYIADAQQQSKQLQKQLMTIAYINSGASFDLMDYLDGLKSEIENLIAVRLNSSLLYPSLAVASEYMRPNRARMSDALAVTLYEMNTENTIRNDPDTYNVFIKTRFFWNKVLSEFRIYLANKTGTFDAKILPRQERSIVVNYNRFREHLKTLLKLADEQKLGFESIYAAKEMAKVSARWFEGFKKIRVIHQSGNWRLDTKILKTRVTPAINKVVNELTRLEELTTVSVTDDINSFARLNSMQNGVLWFVSLLGISFILLVIYSLDKFVFMPIAQVSAALKSEALGKQDEIIPAVKSQEVNNLIFAFSEMSRQVRVRQSELEHLALHDALTGLPNRALLLDRLEHDVNTAKRDQQDLCLLMLDLDRFKEVNDTLGHAVGDDLLVEVGNRLSQVLRNVDTVARFGGDEFAILLPQTNISQAKKISQKIIKILKEAVNFDDIQLYVTASIGIASYPEHGEDVHGLLRMADIAMYVAKNNKSGYEIYNPAIDENSVSKLALTNELREALNNNDLQVYFQPVFNLSGNELLGVEALCRWFHPELGSIPPDSFIPLAEHAGLINELTYWMLEQSVKQLKKWHKINDELSVAVNISVYSFREKNFVLQIKNILNEHDYPCNKLTLEITEGAMMEDPLHAVEVLTELQSMDVNLAVDDFGTGYSSMAYLKKLPVNELKIDKSFVIELDKDESNEAIVRSTIELAHNLNLRVVAEGVETEVVLDKLKAFNCDVAQGYFMSRPVSVEEIEKDYL